MIEKGYRNPATRGYALDTRQEAILVQAGMPAKHVYLEGRNGESLDAIQMRQGELLAVVNGFRVFGKGLATTTASAGAAVTQCGYSASGNNPTQT